MFEIKNFYELYLSTKLAYMINTINRHLIQRKLYSNVYMEINSMLKPEHKPKVRFQIVRKENIVNIVNKMLVCTFCQSRYRGERAELGQFVFP